MDDLSEVRVGDTVFVVNEETQVATSDVTGSGSRDGSADTVLLEADCSMELFAGFFGIDANGTQPECGHTVRLELEPDEIAWENGEPRPAFVPCCPKCGGNMESEDWDIVTP